MGMASASRTSAPHRTNFRAQATELGREHLIMFYDLNLVYNQNDPEISHTLSFLANSGYNIVALTHVITGKLPSTLPANPIPNLPPSVTVPKNLTLLSRATFTISDPSQNHRISSLQQAYNILALRPTNDKALALCCNSLECDIISIDFSQRLPFILKFKTLSSAVQRGIRFEICYSAGITGGGPDARRNLISGATALIRATRSRGIIISSEARKALGVRAPYDVINLAAVWGLGQERGKEAVCEEARKVVALARMKRESYRGVIDVVYGGEKPTAKEPEAKKPAVSNGLKRKAQDTSEGGEQQKEDMQKPMSKRQMKKQVKQARFEAGNKGSTPASTGSTNKAASTGTPANAQNGVT